MASAIWGFAFVAQRKGMEYIGPFTFNGIRFALGSLWLIPFLSRSTIAKSQSGNQQKSTSIHPYLAGILVGLILFIGASLQQTGIVYTSAGKAGFITGLYVIIVPIIGIMLRKPSRIGTWFGAILAAIGLYFLSVTESLTISKGDFLVLIGAFFWAIHVQLIDWLVDQFKPLKLAFLQYITCSILSLVVAFFFEPIVLFKIYRALVPILYAGLFSVGIAYTLQIVAQKETHPSHAAIILSMETVFAALGGYIILGETLNTREIFGCALLFSAMIISQFRTKVPITT